MTLAALPLALLLAAGPPRPTSPPPDPARVAAEARLRALIAGQTVLFVGDSMIVTGLEVWMKYWVKRLGGRYERHATASSTTRVWATSKRLDWALRRYKPALVFVVLGGNELFLPNPKDQAVHVRTILGKLGTTPYYWIGPPIWRKDTGIVQVYEDTVPPGRFYRFNGKRIHRDPDGRHPSLRGARTWAADIVAWVESRFAEPPRPAPAMTPP